MKVYTLPKDSRTPLWLRSRKDQLLSLIQGIERDIELLKNSSWMGEPPWYGRQSELDALYNELHRLECNEAKKQKRKSKAKPVSPIPSAEGAASDIARQIAKAREDALREAAAVAVSYEKYDRDWGERYPDEARKMDERAHRSKTIASAILALLPKEPT